MEKYSGINQYIDEIIGIFKENSNKDNIKQMEKYMKNNFQFLGIKAPQRRKISRVFLRKDNRPRYDQIEIVVKKLWELPEREYQYFACDLLEKYNKDFSREIINLFEYMIIYKSWWDTVDIISKKLVGEYFKQFPKERDEYIKKWIKSNNIWLQRTTILFQLGYKDRTDIELLFNIIEILKDKDEFFIQKAIGWALREYSKTNPKIVKEFIENTKLSPLSEREGMKIVNKIV
ncbi:DNA alkylation repair protein [Anaerosalibacter massiliensis]|uniref:DNA alkylation repair protein n=1 Tax=Anaerosalibacter massiliensis TaxID=1347392 RepID=A0A9X2MG98_9FIRM|nr:DNA alkylation repair protein [Anaerosalibacter massiliensis]MCR2043458.1 DNA alkylation repair protein [Anaerosalibacter massiliensis]